MKYNLWIQREESMSSVLFNEFDNMRDVIKSANDIIALFEKHGMECKSIYETYERLNCTDVYVIIKE